MRVPGPVVFFGTPQFAVPCLEVLADSEFRPELVVSQPSRPAGRGRALRMPPVAERASELGLYVEQVARVRSPAFLERLEAMEPWLAVVVAFGQIFPQRLLDIPIEGCVNVHASLLPRYRGAAPIQAAIAAGDTVTGVTTMRMEAGLDSGPILLEREVPIGAGDMLPEVSEALSTAGAELLLETLRAMAAGALLAQGQQESDVTWAPRLEKSDGYVDWDLPARVLYNRYRAFTPWPGLTAVFRDERGVVARFNGSASWTFFPTRPSRHDGVGVRSAEISHPVENVAPDHGLFRLRCASPRPQAATEH